MDPSKGSNQYSSHSPCKCLFEAMQDDQSQIQSQSPCRHRIVSKNRLKDVIHSLETSKELLKALSRIWRLEHQTSASLSLMSALQFELDRVCVQVNKLLKEQSLERGEIDLILKQFQEEKRIWKIKEGDRIHCAIKCISGELNKERKLRRQTERLNKKLGIELAEMKASLSVASKDLESEKRGRRLLEQVCEEMARGVGEDRAVVEQIKRRSDKVRQEVEKEREMLQLADILREERVQMKLSEAKYQFEEKNAVLDELRDELEAYLQFKKTEKQEKASPTFDKIKELEVYLRETLPGLCKFQSNDQENVEEFCKEYEPADDLHSIKFDLDDMSKSFQWSCAVKNDGTKKPAICTKTKWTDKSTERESSTNKQGDLEVFDNRGLFEFASKSWKKSMEDELQIYNMIKDLRDHIVSGSRIAAASQDLDDPGPNVASSKDTERVACEVYR
ncbi:uncharacterized protein [Primulina eburnea]|uniref:uncharacterized protein n=1 Tax=Primulina eburnea TaxID=1245227 RepID=UPI003C6BF302